MNPALEYVYDNFENAHCADANADADVDPHADGPIVEDNEQDSDSSSWNSTGTSISQSFGGTDDGLPSSR